MTTEIGLYGRSPIAGPGFWLAWMKRSHENVSTVLHLSWQEIGPSACRHQLACKQTYGARPPIPLGRIAFAATAVSNYLSANTSRRRSHGKSLEPKAFWQHDVTLEALTLDCLKGSDVKDLNMRLYISARHGWPYLTPVRDCCELCLQI